MPPGFLAVLDSFEYWLQQRIRQQRDFLEEIHLQMKYRENKYPVQWLADFKSEVANQLVLEWQASGEPIPHSLLAEFKRGDYFWREYVQDWLLSQSLELDPEGDQEAIHGQCIRS